MTCRTASFVKGESIGGTPMIPRDPPVKDKTMDVLCMGGGSSRSHRFTRKQRVHKEM
jgi:hypothetical protein